MRFFDLYGNCPKVLDSGLVGPCFYFDMEYIVGDSIPSLVQRSDLSIVDTIVSQICEVLIEFSCRSMGTLPPKMFKDKIDEIRRSNSVASPAVREAAWNCLSFLDESDWSDIPFGFCHGDFTLENMLVGRDGRLMFIDFLDGPLQSPWLDLAKLHQDCIGRWFLRHSIVSRQISPDNTHIVMMLNLLARRLKPRLGRRFSTAYSRMAALTALQLMRALPYAEDDLTRQFIVKTAASLSMEWQL